MTTPTTAETRCEVVDRIIPCKDKDSRLNIREDDLVLEAGKFEQVARRVPSNQVPTIHDGQAAGVVSWSPPATSSRSWRLA